MLYVACTYHTELLNCMQQKAPMESNLHLSSPHSLFHDLQSVILLISTKKRGNASKQLLFPSKSIIIIFFIFRKDLLWTLLLTTILIMMGAVAADSGVVGYFGSG